MNNITIELSEADLNLIYSALECFIKERLKVSSSARKIISETESFKIIFDKFDRAFEKNNVDFDIFQEIKKWLNEIFLIVSQFEK